MRTRLSLRGSLRSTGLLLMAAVAVWLATCLVLVQLVAATSVSSRATVQIHRHQPGHRRPPARMDHAAQGQQVSMLTAFMTACTPAADWQSLGLYYSFLRYQHCAQRHHMHACTKRLGVCRHVDDAGHAGKVTAQRSIAWTRSKQPGRLVRIAACHAGEREPSPLVPTWRTAGVDNVQHITYPLFNKAWAIAQYMRRAKPPEEYILVLDSDMLIHRPFLPADFGVAPGRAAAENMWYLEVLSSLHWGFACPSHAHCLSAAVHLPQAHHARACAPELHATVRPNLGPVVQAGFSGSERQSCNAVLCRI